LQTLALLNNPVLTNPGFEKSLEIFGLLHLGHIMTGFEAMI
jgi:hypothetical protein